MSEPATTKPKEEKPAKATMPAPDRITPETKTPETKGSDAVVAPASEKSGDAKGVVRRALLAGIDNYPNPINNLPSCVADARAMKVLLESQFGFQEFTELYDANATTAKISQALRWLIQDAEEGCQLVFFYSGHGYQKETAPGIKEEFLALYDDLWKDDELVKLTQSLPPGVLTVILDSCFSGGAEKRQFELVGLKTLDWVDELATRAKIKVFQPDRVQQNEDALSDLRTLALRPFGVSRPILTPNLATRKDLVVECDPAESGQRSLNGLLISACRENETASASTAATNSLSAFTFCFLQALQRLGAAQQTGSLVEETARALEALGFRQRPQLKTPAKPSDMAQRLLFGGPASRKLEAPTLPQTVSPTGLLEQLLQLMVGRQGDKSVSMSESTTNSKFLDILLTTVASSVASTLVRELVKGSPAPQSKGLEDLLGPLIREILKGEASSKSTDVRRAALGEEKILGDLVRIAVGALLKDMAQPTTDKGLGDLAGALLRELLKGSAEPSKAVTPTSGADEKILGDIVREVVRELLKAQMIMPAEPASKGFGDVLRDIVREVLKEGAPQKSSAGFIPEGGNRDKILGDLVREIVREVFKGQAPAPSKGLGDLIRDTIREVLKEGATSEKLILPWDWDRPNGPWSTPDPLRDWLAAGAR